MRLLGTIVVATALAAILTACGGGGEAQNPVGSADPAVAAFEYPAAPEAPPAGADLDPALEVALGDAVESAVDGGLDSAALERIGAADDARAAWVLADLLRFAPPGESAELVDAFTALTGTDPGEDPDFGRSPWQSVSNHLITWDLPAPPGYRQLKGSLFTAVEPAWEPFFADPGATIDFRLLSWGGVLIDDRPLDDPGPCPEGCIPALDDPELTDAAGGDWYPDERIVFGVEVGGAAVAFPKNIMEVHEMVNTTIGGRRLAIPYCTLCGSAQAYFTDRDRVDDEPLVLRTSGLLSRSNKVTYELGTKSVFDTFTGEALSGPLRERGVELDQASVVTSSWGEWKRAHPDTEIVAPDGGIGRSYELDPLGGRDDDGPIFPIGDADPRLPVQEPVLGAIAPGGGAVAFPAEGATEALRRGELVEESGVALELDGDGLIATTGDGEPLAAHESFWFAWSQFHPETALWEPGT